jgi:hypothetical protein
MLSKYQPDAQEDIRDADSGLVTPIHLKSEAIKKERVSP